MVEAEWRKVVGDELRGMKEPRSWRVLSAYSSYSEHVMKASVRFLAEE